MIFNDIQVIKRLKNNPEKKFCLATEIDGTYITTDDEGTIVWKGRGQSGQPLRITVEDGVWVEYEEFISFSDLLDGIFIKYDMCFTVNHRLLRESNLEYEFTSITIDLFLARLYKHFYPSEISEILKYGEFYIE